MKKNGVGFFTGVPDSLLKSFCAYVSDTDPDNNVIAANEGAAVGLAAGYHLATGGTSLVYMQNSGIGNAVNPLLSLVDRDVYDIPLVLLIGWRGEPAFHDEPQHVKQGKVTCALLDAMDIPYCILSSDAERARLQIEYCFRMMASGHPQFAFVVPKGTFEDYTLSKISEDVGSMSREDAIDAVADAVPAGAVIVSTTGMASRELYEFRDRKGLSHGNDFLTVGSMGHASQIALGIAMKKTDRKVVCIDGDGAMIMHMGSMAVIGSVHPRNLIHIVMNNGAHDSVGGQPTASPAIDIPAIARACGYDSAVTVDNIEGVGRAVSSAEGLVLVEVRVRKGARKDLGRPKTTPRENKNDFMKVLGAFE